MTSQQSKQRSLLSLLGSRVATSSSVWSLVFFFPGGDVRGSTAQRNDNSAAATADGDPKNRSDVRRCGICVHIVVHAVPADVGGAQLRRSDHIGLRRNYVFPALYQFMHQSDDLRSHVEAFPKGVPTGT